MPLSQYAGAIIDGAGPRSEGTGRFGIVYIDPSPHGMFFFPDLAHQILADDHRRCTIGFIFAAEAPPG